MCIAVFWHTAIELERSSLIEWHGCRGCAGNFAPLLGTEVCRLREDGSVERVPLLLEVGMEACGRNIVQSRRPSVGCFSTLDGIAVPSVFVNM
jgi:hypothetical protein